MYEYLYANDTYNSATYFHKSPVLGTKAFPPRFPDDKHASRMLAIDIKINLQCKSSGQTNAFQVINSLKRFGLEKSTIL